MKIIDSLKETGRFRLTVFLFAISLYCVVLSALRLYYSRTYGYLFLNWNLFLAFLPWLLTSLSILRKVKNLLAILVVMAVWLMFFPNCLYILTDLIHLRVIDSAPLWLDLILLLSFAWAGLCYGFISLMDIEHFLREVFCAHAKTVAVLSTCMIYVAAFGVYIGRFWRWNSWDLLGNPAALIRETFDRFADGAGFLRVIGFTVLLGTLLNFMYLPFRYRSLRTPHPNQDARRGL
jgi:uncharacterized membrane protein